MTMESILIKLCFFSNYQCMFVDSDWTQACRQFPNGSTRTVKSLNIPDQNSNFNKHRPLQSIKINLIINFKLSNELCLRKWTCESGMSKPHSVCHHHLKTTHILESNQEKRTHINIQNQNNKILIMSTKYLL